MHVLKNKGIPNTERSNITTFVKSRFRKGKIYFPAHLGRATTGAFGHILAKRTYLYHIV